MHYPPNKGKLFSDPHRSVKFSQKHYHFVHTALEHPAVKFTGGKIKVRSSLITVHEGLEKKYSSTLSLTSALHSGGWLTLRPGHFTPGIDTWDPFYRRVGGTRAGLNECVKFDPRTVHSVASRYTD